MASTEFQMSSSVAFLASAGMSTQSASRLYCQNANV